MATIGQAYTTTDPGWKRYDDTDPSIVYTGTTTLDTNASDYQGNAKYFSTITGTSIQFHFRGTKLRLISPVSTNWNSNVIVDIDGVQETFSQNGTLVRQVLVYEKTGLVDEPHIVTITGGTSAYAIYGLDAVEIDDTGDFETNPIYTTENKSADFTSGVRTGALFSGGKLTLLSLDTHNAYGTTDATPTMTAAAAPSGTVASSSEQAGKEGWRAFNNIAQAQGWVTLSGVVTGTLSYDFGASKTINSYTLQTGTSPTEAPNTWTFEGWNGTTWVILDARENIVFAASEKKTFTILNSTAFSKYRINITKNNGQATTLGIAQMELIEMVGGFLYTSSGSYETGIIDLSPRLSAFNKITVNFSFNAASRNEGVIPAMTSNTAPSGVASASAANLGAAWYAFDKSASNTALYWGASSIQFPQWIRYQFPSAKVIGEYAITPYSSRSFDPKSWTFEGSNDGTTWIILDTQVNQSFSAGGIPVKYPINNMKSYTYYQLNISSGVNASEIVIWELGMTEIGFGNQSVTISTSTSTDLQTWSSHTPLNSDGTIASPFGRYIKIKVDLVGATNTERNLMTFGTADVAKFQANNFVAFDGALHLSTSFAPVPTTDAGFVDPNFGMYRLPLNLDQFKTINSINISFS